MQVKKVQVFDKSDKSVTVDIFVCVDRYGQGWVYLTDLSPIRSRICDLTRHYPDICELSFSGFGRGRIGVLDTFGHFAPEYIYGC